MSKLIWKDITNEYMSAYVKVGSFDIRLYKKGVNKLKWFLQIENSDISICHKFEFTDDHLDKNAAERLNAAIDLAENCIYSLIEGLRLKCVKALEELEVGDEKDED